jgi:hypothetical protein
MADNSRPCRIVLPDLGQLDTVGAPDREASMSVPRRLWVIPSALLMCSPAAAQLSPEQKEVLEATAFVFAHLEEGNSDSIYKQPVKRTMIFNGIQFEFTFFNQTEAERVSILSIEKCVVEIPEYDYRIDFNKVFRFEANQISGFLEMEGHQAYCKNNECRDTYSEFILGTATGNVDRKRLSRLQRAIDFIRARCPGKPY